MLLLLLLVWPLSLPMPMLENIRRLPPVPTPAPRILPPPPPTTGGAVAVVARRAVHVHPRPIQARDLRARHARVAASPPPRDDVVIADAAVRERLRVVHARRGLRRLLGQRPRRYPPPPHHPPRVFVAHVRIRPLPLLGVTLNLLVRPRPHHGLYTLPVPPSVQIQALEETIFLLPKPEVRVRGLMQRRHRGGGSSSDGGGRRGGGGRRRGGGCRGRGRGFAVVTVIAASAVALVGDRPPVLHALVGGRVGGGVYPIPRNERLGGRQVGK